MCPAPFLFPFSAFHLCFRAGLSEPFRGGCLTCSQWDFAVCGGQGGTEHLQKFANPVCFVSLPCPRYFSLQATHPLGFDDSVRLEIESNICREGGPLPNCFTTPLRQAWTTMETVRSFFRVGFTLGEPDVGVLECAPDLSCSFTDLLLSWMTEQLQENLPDSFPQPDLKIPPTGCC